MDLRHVRARRWGFDRWRAAASLLAVLCLALSAGPRRPSQPNASAQPASPGTQRSLDQLASGGVSGDATAPHGDAQQAAGYAEPSLPPLLEVTRSQSDPDQIDIRVLPNIEGLARLEVNASAPMVWTSRPAAARFALKPGSAPGRYSLRLNKLPGGEPRHVRIGLVIENERGETLLTVHEELAVDSPAGKATQHGSRSSKHSGVSQRGQPVAASVPFDAPEPIVEGDR